MDNIESKLTKILDTSLHDEFIFDFLGAYNVPKSSIDRVRKGDLNTLEETGEFILRKKVHFKISDKDLYSTIDSIKNNLVNNKSKPRFVIVTNFNKLLAFDTKFGDTLDIQFSKLDKHYDFFLPLAGVEKQQYQNENIADVKAANKLAKLFDEVVKDNEHSTIDQRHALNIFLSRLLFCYFAEDTNIFTVSQFTNSLASHTKPDGSDTHIFLEKLFDIFNIEKRNNGITEYLNVFPYVNGKLFQNKYAIPEFTTKSRKLLIELGQLDWSGINPDIFGSMLQAVMDSEERGNMGSHYTSVPNIMKVIQPLFLDNLYEAFEECNGNQKNLIELLKRIGKIKFFDPACGSGNFLIITYKEIRRLEIQILKQLSVGWTFGHSNISLSQFYGIEINDFAHETAKLSLYLAEHQMNVEFEKEVGIATESLPLKLGGNIVCGNANRIDREHVCTKEEGDEIYIMGNPPYIGFKKQNKTQKNDMKYVFTEWKNYKKMDYISCRFYKGANYIRNFNAQYAFVSTNSISQGEQVGLLWESLLGKGLEIGFAYQSFKWKNNAKSNAAVIVVIIGLRNSSNIQKYIYKDQLKQLAYNINPYLVDGKDIFVSKLSKPLSDFPKMKLGNMPKDDGNLILSDQEKNKILTSHPECKPFIRRLIGAYEFLNGSQRWCFWIKEKNLGKALEIDEIRSRIQKVKDFRLASSDKSAKKMGETPYKFREQHEAGKMSVIIPTVTSARREYIPLGYLDKESIVVAPNNVLYDPDLYLFGILSSRLHVIWVKAVGGKLKSDLRYSSVLCYNTFPFPYITKKQKEEIEGYVYAVLDEREKHSEKTLSEMYDPDKMPEGLKNVHHELDLSIERCYRPKPFDSDEERLEYLFRMYEKMIAKKKEDNKYSD